MVVPSQLHCYNGSLRVVRTIFLLLAMLLGQAHACAQTFVTANGDPCSLCVPSLDQSIGALQQDTISPDCRDCCFSVPVDGDHGATSVATAPLLLDLHFAILEVPVLSIALPVCPVHRIGTWCEEVWPNAPPAHTQGRSPPLRLN